MNILLGVHQFFPDHYAGTERYALNLARGLLALGHRVRVLTYDLAGKGQRLGPAGRLRMHEYVYQGVPVTAFRHEELPEFVFDLQNEHFAEETAALLRKEEFDVYHVAHPLRIGGSVKAAKARGVPIVFMLTDYWMMCPLGILLRLDNTQCEGPDKGTNCLRHCFAHKYQSDFDTRLDDAREMLGCADRVLSPSNFLIGAFQYNEFLPAERVRLSRHGFDYGNLHPGGSTRRDTEHLAVGYIGTLQYHKGVHILVQAFRKVRSARLSLEIWGGAFHETDYEAFVRRLAHGDPRIRFHGSYEYDDLQQVVETLDVVVVPSIWYENAPLTISSSHAMGIPVIASDVGGMAEMVRDGENGFTFAVGDADSLAQRLELIARSPQLIDQFRAAILPPRHVEEEVFAMERLYRSLAATRA